MNTLFHYTQDRVSGRWIANSDVLSITLECDSQEEMLESVASAITAWLESGRKHGDLSTMLSRL